MQILVTGSTGFIGGHFVQQALAAGHRVRALRRSGSHPRLSLAVEPQWIDMVFDGIEPAHFEGCDALVHFASAGVSPQRATWQDMLQCNVLAQTTLLDAARQAGVRRCVLAGSFAEYGRSADHYDHIPPTAPLLPTSGYPASKAAGFVAAHGYAMENALELHYLRIFSAFGEGQFDSNFWPALRAAALSGEDFKMTPGEQVRDYIDVRDVARAFLMASERRWVAGGPVVENVGSGRAVSMRRFAEHWWREWGAKGSLRVGALPYRAGEIMRFVPETTAQHRGVSAPWAT